MDLYSDAAAVFHAVGAGEDEGWCLYRLGLVMLKAGDGGLAVAYFNDARGVFGGEGRREEEGKCLLRIGEAMAKVEPGMAVDPLSEVRTSSPDSSASTVLTLSRLEWSGARTVRVRPL